MGSRVFWPLYNFFKKIVGVCRAHFNKWEALAPFRRRVWCLLVTIGSLPRWHPKHRATSTWWGDACWSLWHGETHAIIFLLPSLFSLLHLRKGIGLAKLQSDLQSFNCIEFDFFFSILSPSIWFFMFFLIKFDPHSFYSYLFCF